jgi:hypothetical protein
VRCEAEVHSRLDHGEAELQRLTADITKLSLEVKLGGEGWRSALEALSAKYEQRRGLQAQLDSLRWVLTGEPTLRTGSRHPEVASSW